MGRRKSLRGLQLSDTKPIRHISETAMWAAVYRARESERADALFKDPLARRLAGDQMDAAMPFHDDSSWAWALRTCLFDHFIHEQSRLGVDMVLNLAAGLDTRPYRMDLPPSLTWVEVDLPEVMDYKAELLGSETAVCTVERVSMDLTDVKARQALFAALDGRARKTLVISEGLLIYLTADQVGSLAADLGVPPSFQRWVLDLLSPGLLKIVQQNTSPQFGGSVSAPQFAPDNGPQFFVPFQWKPVAVSSMVHTAAELKRLPEAIAHLARLPDEPDRMGARPWSGVCLLRQA